MKYPFLFLLLTMNFSLAGFPLTSRLTAGGKAREAEIIVSCTEEKAAKKGICIFCGNVWYRLFFSEHEIQALKNASGRYFSDFDARKLRKKDRSKKEKYGKIPLFLEWGSSREKTDRRADAKASAGYIFRNASPYFALYVPSVENQDKETESKILQSSGDIPLLFNRAQLKDLIDKMTAL